MPPSNARLLLRAPRLVYVTTLPVTPYLLLRGQLAWMREQGFDVTVVSSPGPDLDRTAEREQVRSIGVAVPRDPAPAADLTALRQLVKTFRRVRPDIVNASTPKAGLLGMMAAKIARVPVRIYLLRGLRLETATGTTRRILEASERMASACSHSVIAVSRSLREAYVAGGFVAPGGIRVLQHGSSNGVNTERFTVTDAVRTEAQTLRESLGIPEGSQVVGFAGRMVEDKGIRPLLQAFEDLATRHDVHLVLVGDDLAGDSVPEDLRRRVVGHPQMHGLPRMESLAPFYTMLDVLAFPSMREGFPNVPVECAACERPVVGFRSTGVVDAVVHGQTGTIVERNADALRDGLERYLSNPDKARQHGLAGRARVEASFRPEVVWAAWKREYVRLLGTRGLPLPRPR